MSTILTKATMGMYNTFKVSSVLNYMRSTTTPSSQRISALCWFTPINRCDMGSKALIKTNKSAAKRMRIRGGGSLKRGKAGASHNTGYKTRARSNRLGQSCGIKEAKIEKRMRRLLGK
mmetsp:Transcript_22793/g.34028  ORF Transcript_22793/g.34028 Transcript_22793/m.34028 type:complete len:118 (+) Transcript_22793:101-454(+)